MGEGNCRGSETSREDEEREAEEGIAFDSEEGWYLYPSPSSHRPSGRGIMPASEA